MQVVKFETVSFLDDPQGDEIFVEAIRGFDDIWQVNHDFGGFRWYGTMDDIVKETRKVLKIKETFKKIKAKIFSKN
jgi:hypothetical protein